MKKADVKVGATYRAKVSSKVVEVRIDAESPHGGWDATNLATGKKVRIKCAQRLRASVEGVKATTAAPAAKDAAKGTKPAATATDAARANVAQRRARPAAAATGPAIKATEKARKEAIKVADANLAAIEAAENGAKPAGAKRMAKATEAKPAAPKRVSAIDAAAQILAKAKEPMRCKDIIAAMTERGLWSSPGGKTPEATLNAAIIRDIAKKGKESRFVKAGRGLFAANPDGGE